MNRRSSSKMSEEEVKLFDEKVAKAKKSMRDGQPTPLGCSCGGFLVITRNCEGFQEACFCRSCGLMYNLKIIATRLVAHHNYTVDFYGVLHAPTKNEPSIQREKEIKELEEKRHDDL